MATKNQTRPSCGKFKVEVDLLVELSKRIHISEKDDITGKTKLKWISIKCDYVPRYCKECYLQGHSKNECWIIHPEQGKQDQPIQSGINKEST